MLGWVARLAKPSRVLSLQPTISGEADDVLAHPAPRAEQISTVNTRLPMAVSPPSVPGPRMPRQFQLRVRAADGVPELLTMWS